MFAGSVDKHPSVTGTAYVKVRGIKGGLKSPSEALAREVPDRRKEGPGRGYTLPQYGGRGQYVNRTICRSFYGLSYTQFNGSHHACKITATR